MSTEAAFLLGFVGGMSFALIWVGVIQSVIAAPLNPTEEIIHNRTDRRARK